MIHIFIDNVKLYKEICRKFKLDTQMDPYYKPHCCQHLTFTSNFQNTASFWYIYPDWINSDDIVIDLR